MTVKVKIRVKRLADVPLPSTTRNSPRGWTFAPCSRGRSCLRGRARAHPDRLGDRDPEGFEGQVRPRSGLCRFGMGVTVLNSPGRSIRTTAGEVKVVLINHGQEEFVVCNADRIAQLVIAAVARGRLR